MSKLRVFFRSVETLQHELQDFRSEECVCQCCFAGHRNKDGSRMETCDRQILFTCICRWYGSIKALDNVVRTQVLTFLTTQLSSHVLTYKESVFMAVPILWHHLDTAAEKWDFILRPRPGHPLNLRQPDRMHRRTSGVVEGDFAGRCLCLWPGFPYFSSLTFGY